MIDTPGIITKGVKPRVLLRYDSQDSAEWQQLRDRLYHGPYIGGSECPSIMGSVGSPYKLMAQKKGLIQKDELPTNKIRLGNILEEPTGREAAEMLGIKIRKRNVVFQHSVHDFMLANIDFEVITEKAGMEVKTTQSPKYIDLYRAGEIPPSTYDQIQHYIEVFNADHWYLAVQILGYSPEIKVFKIERDEARIAEIVEAESRFIELFRLNEMPEPDGSDDASDAIDKLMPVTEQTKLEANDEALYLKQEYIQLRDEYNTLGKLKSSIGNKLKAITGNHKGINGVCYWSVSDYDYLDKDKLQKLYPEAYKACCETRQRKVFNVR